jgi:hypothetical protein
MLTWLLCLAALPLLDSYRAALDGETAEGEEGEGVEAHLVVVVGEVSRVKVEKGEERERVRFTLQGRIASTQRR